VGCSLELRYMLIMGNTTNIISTVVFQVEICRFTVTKVGETPCRKRKAITGDAQFFYDTIEKTTTKNKIQKMLHFVTLYQNTR
jgi:hypothetical protein